jgi:hypothetical protein
LSLDGKRQRVTKNYLIVVGKAIKCKHAAAIIREIESTFLNWKKFTKEVGVSSYTVR